MFVDLSPGELVASVPAGGLTHACAELPSSPTKNPTVAAESYTGPLAWTWRAVVHQCGWLWAGGKTGLLRETGVKKT